MTSSSKKDGVETHFQVRQGHRDSISRMRLGRGSNVGGRGGGGSAIYTKGIGHMRLARDGNAKTDRRVVA